MVLSSKVAEIGTRHSSTCAEQQANLLLVLIEQHCMGCVVYVAVVPWQGCHTALAGIRCDSSGLDYFKLIAENYACLLSPCLADTTGF